MALLTPFLYLDLWGSVTPELFTKGAFFHACLYGNFWFSQGGACFWERIPEGLLMGDLFGVEVLVS